LSPWINGVTKANKGSVSSRIRGRPRDLLRKGSDGVIKGTGAKKKAQLAPKTEGKRKILKEFKINQPTKGENPAYREGGYKKIAEEPKGKQEKILGMLQG